MTTTRTEDRRDLLQGTLDMLILRTLAVEPTHGHGIVRSIRLKSDEVLRVDHGSLYPALQRLQRKGWITSHSAKTENNRTAKYYSLTASERRQLARETEKWKRVSGAIALVMRAQES